MIREIKIGAGIMYLNLGLSTLVSLIYTPFMLSYIGASEYGLYTLSLSIVSYLNLLDNGLAASVVRYLSFYRGKGDNDRQKSIINTSVFIYLVLSVIVFVFGLLFVNNADVIFAESFSAVELEKLRVILTLLVLYLSIQFVVSIYSSCIVAYERFIFHRSVKLLSTILTPAIMTPLLLMGYKAISLTVVMIVLGLSSSIAYILYCIFRLKIKVNIASFRKDDFKDLLNFTLPLLFVYACDAICRSFGQFYIGVVEGTVSIAVLSLIIQLRGYAESFVKSLSNFFLPRFSEMVGNFDDKDKISDVFIRICRIECHMGLVLIGVFFLIGRDFIKYWASDIAVDNIYWGTLLIFIPLVFSMAESVGEEIIKAYNIQKYQVFVYLFKVLVILSISIYFAKDYGLYSCVAAIALSMIFGDMIFMNIIYSRILKLNIRKLMMSFGRQGIVMMAVLTIDYTASIMYDCWISKLVIFLVCLVFIYYPLAVNNTEKSIFKNPMNKIYEKVYRKN